MRYTILVLALIAACRMASAQVYDDGIVASATRTVTLPPTDAVISVSVTTTSQKTLDDVMAKVRDLGITLDQLSTITSTAAYIPSLPGASDSAAQTVYQFLVPVPLAQTASTLQRFNQPATAAATAEYRIRADVSRITTSVAAALDAQRRIYPELFKQAKERAEEMARQAGYSPGRVLAITDSYSAAALVSAYLSQFNYPMSVSVRIAFE